MRSSLDHTRVCVILRDAVLFSVGIMTISREFGYIEGVTGFGAKLLKPCHPERSWGIRGSSQWQKTELFSQLLQPLHH